MAHKVVPVRKKQTGVTTGDDEVGWKPSLVLSLVSHSVSWMVQISRGWPYCDANTTVELL